MVPTEDLIGRHILRYPKAHRWVECTRRTWPRHEMRTNRKRIHLAPSQEVVQLFQVHQANRTGEILATDRKVKMLSLNRHGRDRKRPVSRQSQVCFELARVRNQRMGSGLYHMPRDFPSRSDRKFSGCPGHPSCPMVSTTTVCVLRLLLRILEHPHTSPGFSRSSCSTMISRPP
jgi:hypothetical protein